MIFKRLDFPSESPALAVSESMLTPQPDWVVVRAATEVVARTRRATEWGDERTRRIFSLPDHFLLSVADPASLPQERLLIELLAAGRVAANLVICARRSRRTDQLLHRVRRLHSALRVHFVYEYSAEELSAFYRLADGMVYLADRRSSLRPVVEAVCAATPALLSDTPPNRRVAGDAACYVASDDPDLLVAALQRILEDTAYRQRLVGLCRERMGNWSAVQQVEPVLAE